jgi:hypothetical protein
LYNLAAAAQHSNQHHKFNGMQVALLYDDMGLQRGYRWRRSQGK